MNTSELFMAIQNDLKNHGGKRIPSIFKTYFFNPSFRLLLNYRIGRYFYLKSDKRIYAWIAKFYRYKQITKRSCQISFKAILKNNIKFPHPIGIVIGDEVIIENNVKIWQNVTIGSHGKARVKLQYPAIKSGTRIYEGATIIGGITIGKDSIIGAKSFVNKNIPDNSIAYGIPAKFKERG